MAQKKLNLFFDLDGTLIDISKRHYKVYREMVLELNGKPLSKVTYWNLKRSNTDWPSILKKSLVSSNKLPLFLKKFISKIELPENLSMDRVFSYTLKTLNILGRKHFLYLITSRRFPKETLSQITNLGLKDIFKKIVMGEKNKYLKNKIDFIVGDTEAEILLARELKVISVAVYTGIRNKIFLQKMNPDFIIKDISHLPVLLTKL